MFGQHGSYRTNPIKQTLNKKFLYIISVWIIKITLHNRVMELSITWDNFFNYILYAVSFIGLSLGQKVLLK